MLNNSWWAHFIGPVLTVIGVLILAVASLAWRTVLKIEQKLESYLQIQMECQKHLPEKYVQWEIFNKVFDELKDNRKERWNEYDRHAHAHGGAELFGNSQEGAESQDPRQHVVVDENRAQQYRDKDLDFHGLFPF